MGHDWKIMSKLIKKKDNKCSLNIILKYIHSKNESNNDDSDHDQNMELTLNE